MKIGFVGLGNMGGPMCRNMMKGVNHEVVVHDLNPEAVRACTEAGATAAESLAALAASCDLIFTSLPTPKAVEAVVDGHRAQPSARARRCSTSAPMRPRW